LTGELVDGTSLCKPVAGTVSETFRSTRGSERTVVESNVSKNINDQYWRVSAVKITNEDTTETFEYFVRELRIYQTLGTSKFSESGAYFICDFVDIE